MVPWLGPEDPFPPVERALREPNGLLCAGADLSLERLIAAYRGGIFPWYSGAEPILWWSPDPRMVLYCDDLKISRSLAKNTRNKGYEVRVDTAFADVGHNGRYQHVTQPARDGLSVCRHAHVVFAERHVRPVLLGPTGGNDHGGLPGHD